MPNQTHPPTDTDEPPDEYPGDPTLECEAIDFEDDAGTEWFDIFESAAPYRSAVMIDYEHAVPIER